MMECPAIGDKLPLGKCCMTEALIVVENKGSNLILYARPADPEDPVQYVSIDSEEVGRNLLAVLQDWFRD